jgi:hypothetical protein
MLQRHLTEIELRAMLHKATEYGSDLVPGRWRVHAYHARAAWDVVVEPDAEERLLVVVTAYPLGE